LAPLDWAELAGAGFPVLLPVVRWQSFGSPPEAPGVVLLSEGLPASAPEPAEFPPVLLPFMLVPPAALLPEPVLVPDASPVDEEPPVDVPPLVPPAPPELPEDWAMTDVARLSANADVARIFKIMGITFGWAIVATG
jgi:hypothetical protein